MPFLHAMTTGLILPLAATVHLEIPQVGSRPEAAEFPASRWNRTKAHTRSSEARVPELPYAAAPVRALGADAGKDAKQDLTYQRTVIGYYIAACT